MLAAILHRPSKVQERRRTNGRGFGHFFIFSRFPSGVIHTQQLLIDRYDKHLKLGREIYRVKRNDLMFFCFQTKVASNWSGRLRPAF